MPSPSDFENFSTEKLQAFYKEQNASYNLIYDSQEAANEDIEYYKQFVLGTDGEVYDEKITLTPQPQVSITIEDQHTGCIVAMVGGRGAKEGSKTLNRATDTTRQPGSTFKIVAVYAPALDSAGLTLATMVNDAPFNYANGRPVKFGIYQFNNPAGLSKEGSNNYSVTVASGAAVAENGNAAVKQTKTHQYYTEASNVDVANEMVNLIVAQRAYEMNSKAIQASDEMMQQANALR